MLKYTIGRALSAFTLYTNEPIEGTTEKLNKQTKKDRIMKLVRLLSVVTFQQLRKKYVSVNQNRTVLGKQKDISLIIRLNSYN